MEDSGDFFRPSLLGYSNSNDSRSEPKEVWPIWKLGYPWSNPAVFPPKESLLPTLTQLALSAGELSTNLDSFFTGQETTTLASGRYADVFIFNMSNRSLYNESVSENGVETSMSASDWVRDLCLGLILALLSLLTFVGNAMVLYAVRTERRLQTVSNMFIVSLAIADLTVGLIVMPIGAIYIFTADWLYGVILCQFWIGVDYTASTASILNLFILSLDRYWSVTSPLKYLRRRTKRRALVMISLVWFVSSLWIIPIIAWHHFEHGGHRTVPSDVCDTEYATNTSLKIITGILNYYLPLAFMYALYIKIFLEIHTRSKMEIGQRTAGGAVTHENPAISGSISDESVAVVDAPPLTVSNGGPMPHPMRLRIHNIDKSSANTRLLTGASYLKIGTKESIATDSERTDYDLTNSDCYSPLRSKLERYFDSSEGHCSESDASGKLHCEFDEAVVNEYFEEHDLPVIRVSTADCGARTSLCSDGDMETCLTIGPTVDGTVEDSSGKVRFKVDEDGEDSHRYKILPKENHPNKNKYVKPRRIYSQRYSGDVKHSESANNSTKCSQEATVQIKAMTSTLQKDFTITSSATRNNNNNAVLPEHRQRKHSALVAQARRWKHKVDKKQHRPSSALSKEIKAARQLGVIMGAFTLCFFPYFVCFMVVAFCSSCVSPNLMTTVTWVGYLNSTLNPFLYPLCNATFRHKFRKMLRMRSKEKDMRKNSAYYAAITTSAVRHNHCVNGVNSHYDL